MWWSFDIQQSSWIKPARKKRTINPINWYVYRPTITCSLQRNQLCFDGMDWSIYKYPHGSICIFVSNLPEWNADDVKLVFSRRLIIWYGIRYDQFTFRHLPTSIELRGMLLGNWKVYILFSSVVLNIRGSDASEICEAFLQNLRLAVKSK